MWAQIFCYKNQGIHWYHCNPTFLWQINFRLVRRLISALIWDISGLWNRSDGRDYREKRIAISRFLTPYIILGFLVFLVFDKCDDLVIHKIKAAVNDETFAILNEEEVEKLYRDPTMSNLISVADIDVEWDFITFLFRFYVTWWNSWFMIL